MEEIEIMEKAEYAISKIEQGVFDLIGATTSGNESLIHRSEVLKALQGLIRTLQMSTRRRLTGKPNANPGKTIDTAFEKFSVEIRG